jgi:hypothetical protein
MSNESRVTKIKYCETGLDHLVDSDKEKVLYQTFNVYLKYAPIPNSEDYDNKLAAHTQELARIFPENAVGTIIDLSILNDEGLDIMYNFIKAELKD